jgi:adenine-specific DNA-methyltransferase
LNNEKAIEMLDSVLNNADRSIMGETGVATHILTMNDRVKQARKDLGIFFTPQWVVDFMINLIEEDKLNELSNVNLLEPACGMCQFLLGIKRNKKHIFDNASVRIGVEINKEIAEYLLKNNLALEIEIINEDYLLWETDKHFDIILGNPPYGIPSLSPHYTIKVDNKTKSKYKKIYETWYGKYNVYGAFIEKSIKLLKENGQLIFIVPATFMILDEFKKLREFLAKNGKTEIVYMGSDVFKPEADVTTVVLKFIKSKIERGELLLYDYNNGKIKLLTQNNRWTGNVILFSTEFSKKVDEICSFRLGDIYDVRISPRTPEIKHNPIVIKFKEHIGDKNLLPILNGGNLKIGTIVYKSTTGYWIEADKKTKLRKFFSEPHIVVGLGFRGNRQIGAAYDHKAYPWMGDVYHLLRKHTLTITKFDLDDEEVVKFLNSEIIRRYVNDVFRDITYHFSITQLKLLPLPTKDELRKLEETLL